MFRLRSLDTVINNLKPSVFIRVMLPAICEVDPGDKHKVGVAEIIEHLVNSYNSIVLYGDNFKE